jgi:hypothetical protein
MPFYHFEFFQEAYFIAAAAAAQVRGLTTEAFIRQQLSSWLSSMGINQMR